MHALALPQQQQHAYFSTGLIPTTWDVLSGPSSSLENNFNSAQSSLFSITENEFDHSEFLMPPKGKGKRGKIRPKKKHRGGGGGSARAKWAEQKYLAKSGVLTDNEEPPKKDERNSASEWFTRQMWPFPRPGSEAGESSKRPRDELLVDFMAWYDVSPDAFATEKARFQYVRSSGLFQCGRCHNKWSSSHTWTQFDLFEQSVRLLGQRCRACEDHRFYRPLPFNHQIWRKCCMIAIDKSLLALESPSQSVSSSTLPATSTVSLRTLPPASAASQKPHPDTIKKRAQASSTKPKPRQVSVRSNAAVEAEPEPLTQEELHELDEKCVDEHKITFCEKCLHEKGPCWTPHRPGECLRCLESASGFCFDPHKFLDNVIVMHVDKVPREKPKPYIFSSKPKILETKRLLSVLG